MRLSGTTISFLLQKKRGLSLFDLAFFCLCAAIVIGIFVKGACNLCSSSALPLDLGLIAAGGIGFSCPDE